MSDAALRASVDAAEWAYDIEELLKASGLCKCLKLPAGEVCLVCSGLVAQGAVGAINGYPFDLF